MNSLSLDTSSYWRWSPSKSSKRTGSPSQMLSPERHLQAAVEQLYEETIQYYETSIFDFTVPTAYNQDVVLHKFKGKKLYLVVNVAAYAGSNALADENYTQLQRLYEKYHHDLEILAFLSDDFTGESSTSSHQMARNAKAKGITFPIFGKIHCDVECHGSNIHGLYGFLTSTGSCQGPVEWNFAKFLCDADGVPIGRYAPYRPPKSLEADIIACLSVQPSPLPEPYATILQESALLNNPQQAAHYKKNISFNYHGHGHHKKKMFSGLAKTATEMMLRTTRRWSQMNIASPMRRMSGGIRPVILSPKKIHVMG